MPKVQNLRIIGRALDTTVPGKVNITPVAVVLAIIGLAALPGSAKADVPVGPAHYVPCPPPTGDAGRYTGPAAPYICHSAVMDPVGDVIILRRGQSYAATP